MQSKRPNQINSVPTKHFPPPKFFPSHRRQFNEQIPTMSHLARTGLRIMRGRFLTPSALFIHPPSHTIISRRGEGAPLHMRTHPISRPISRYLLLPLSTRIQYRHLITPRDKPPSSNKPTTHATKSPPSSSPSLPDPKEQHIPSPPPPEPPTLYWDGEPMYVPIPLVWLFRPPLSPLFWVSMTGVYLSNEEDISVHDFCKYCLLSF